MGVGQQNTNRQQDNGTEDWDALKGDVGDIADAAVERSRYFIDTAREQATDYVDRRKDDIAQSIRERTFADFFNEFEGVVRRRPATVAAVSVAVGFLAARFIKSTAEDLRYDSMNAGSAQGGQGRSRQQGQQGQQRSRAKASA
jgi:hypothetical protein